MKTDLWSIVKDKKCVVFDGDGTLYLGDTLIDHAMAFLDELTRHQIPFYICTNNSSKTPSEYVKKYAALHLPFDKDHILISSHAALSALKQHHITQPYIVGTESVRSWFSENGITHNDTHTEAVLLTYDTELTYKKIEVVTHLIRKGLPYFATHPDMVCPTDKGPIPDVGTWIEMFEVATSRRPDTIFGKPSASILTPLLERYNATLKDIVFIGDRLYTDIALGEGNDLTTVLVLTGETDQKMADASTIKANLTVENLRL
jgi:HAD superfamily hydrolase (TIGR01450 family)